MENFIGNNAKIIVQWGQPITIAIILLALFLLYRTLRKNKYFLPRGFRGFLTTIFLGATILFSGLVFAKISSIKPRMSHVINGLDALVGKQAPDLSFKLLATDEEAKLASYKGKVVILNFWATWCAPCVKEMPELNKLQETYRDKGLEVIVLSDESKDRLIKYTEKKELKATAVYTPKFGWANIDSERPISFLIDKDGMVAEYYTGAYDFEYFEEQVRPYLAE